MENTLPTTHYFFTLPIKKRITHRDLLPTYDSDDEDEDDDDTEGDRFEWGGLGGRYGGRGFGGGESGFLRGPGGIGLRRMYASWGDLGLLSNGGDRWRGSRTGGDPRYFIGWGGDGRRPLEGLRDRERLIFSPSTYSFL